MSYNNKALYLATEAKVLLERMAEVLRRLGKAQALPLEERIALANEAKYVYTPIAHRLGLVPIKGLLEDLYLRLYHSPVYHTLDQLLSHTYGDREAFLQEFKKPIEALLQKAGFHFTTKTRVKSIQSLISKMERLQVRLDEIYDVLAIRIILDVPKEEELEACWRVYDLLSLHYRFNPTKLRDWLSSPRASGYQALHVTLMGEALPWVEVQIRTRRMDEIAEKGNAAHWKYKEGDENTLIEPIDDWLLELRTWVEQHPIEVQEIFAEQLELVRQKQEEMALSLSHSIPA